MKPVRAAVVGVGYVGAFHAEKYVRHPDVRLVGLVDTNPERAAAVAARLGTEVVPNVEALLGRVDCASVATPTPFHVPVARRLLLGGVDVLVEKPLAADLGEARSLVALAAERRRILQVGHLERFNPAVRALRPILHRPRFVECHRLAPFSERGTEVDVVLDLMIHDLDILLSAIAAPVERIEAVGVPVLSPAVDIANVRLRFADGAIANLTASRVTTRRERRIRFFQADAYVAVDYDARTLQIFRRVVPEDGGAPRIEAEVETFPDADPLADEVDAFVRAVRDRGRPVVDGAEALRVLEVAEAIREAMESV